MENENFSDGDPLPSGSADRESVWHWIKVVVLGAGIFTGLYLILTPSGTSCGRPAVLIRAMSNARQIGMALCDFESKYGRFPNADTAARVKENHPSDWNLPDETSNDLFRQLIAAKIVTSEEIFFADQPGCHKPDNVISTEPHALAIGECGFAYIIGGSGAIGAASNRPLIVTPLIPNTLEFDPVPFEGRAVILRADNTVFACPINAEGRAIGPGGMDILDPRQAYWNGTPPVVKWPRLLPLPVTPATLARGVSFRTWAGISVAAILLGGGIWIVSKRKRTDKSIGNSSLSN